MNNYIYIFFFFIIQYIITYPKFINITYFFKEILLKNKVKKILINNKKNIYIQLYKKFLKENFFNFFKRYQYTFDIGDLVLFHKQLDKFKKKYKIKYLIEFKNIYQFNLYNFLINNSLLIFIIIFIIIVFNIIPNNQTIKSNVKLYNNENNIKFKDIAGLYKAKIEIKEVVHYLKNPNKYNKLGGKIPKGILLVGPPGTGKTMLAKAVAGEAKVPFFYLSGSSFVELYIGVGSSRVRTLFNKAKEVSPSIIFIDEIDTIGRARSTNHISNYNDEKENTLNQLLTEMDGFEENTNVFVIAATNRLKILDKALLRPGRFDRKIVIKLPNIIERKDIFKKYLHNIIVKKNINLDLLVKETSGLSGADISNICNEAALIAARKNKQEIDNEDFGDSIDRFYLGIEGEKKIFNYKEKKRIAYHEAGHVLVNYILNKNKKIIKASILPRGSSLGTTLILPDPDNNNIEVLYNIKKDICVLLSGRASEYIIYKNYSTGALNDLENSTQMAYNMIINYGYSTNISYKSLIDNNTPYSKITAYKIDKILYKIINNEFKRAKRILHKKIKKLHILSKNLLKKEVLFEKDIDLIMKI
ncbi:MAG: ATP-dependent zinc metalloprotease FtsH [Candidatus Shikimatogenerans bostrichidophilus]|nr:MAG: ATP-dependent zinc metalloprotease FtsH [Candidatus Shikimatogenerans bostrichidophilus]